MDFDRFGLRVISCQEFENHFFSYLILIKWHLMAKIANTKIKIVDDFSI